MVSVPVNYIFMLCFQQKSTFTTAREIVRENGLGTKGLNKGLTATLGRHGVFNMIYFSFYHNIKGIIPEAKVSTPQPLYNTVRYNTVLYIALFKDGSKKCIDYIEK